MFHVCDNIGDIVVHVATDWIVHDKRIFEYDVSNMIHVNGCQMGQSKINVSYNVFITEDHFNTFVDPSSQHWLQDQGTCTTIRDYTVIDPWFDPNDFPCFSSYRATATLASKPYFLFLARCQMYKGLHFFIALANKCPNEQFVVAGGCTSYDPKTRTMQLENRVLSICNLPTLSSCFIQLPSNVEYVGCVQPHQRSELLSNAIALIQPTEYREPCGWNVIESMFSGTPVSCIAMKDIVSGSCVQQRRVC